MTIHDEHTKVAAPPRVGQTGGDQSPPMGKAAMAAIDTHTTTPAPPPTQGEDDGGRNWMLIWAIVGLVAFFTAIGIYIAMNQGDTPTPTPTPTASVSDEQAAYDASTKTVTDMLAWAAANPGDPTPETFATREYIKQDLEFIDQLSKGGRHLEGSDKVLWVKPVDYTINTVTVKACLEVHGKILDKDGNNVRVDPTGKPIAEGTQTGITYVLTPGSQRGSWIISSGQVTTAC